MKKLVIASAVAAALVSGSALAETTAYGKVRLVLELGTEDAIAAGTDRQGITNSTSRFGFKFSEDLGNGMKAFAQYEAVTGDNQGDGVGTRLLFAGLSGDFGQVGMGSQWTPTYTLVRGKHDPFESVGGNVYGGGFLAPARTSDAIWYLNTFGSVTFAIATVASDGSDTINDATDIAVSVPVGPVTIGLASQSYDGSDTPSPFTVNIGWASGDLSVDAGFFMRDRDETTTDKGDDSVAITAGFKTASGKITAQIEDDGASGESQTSVGYSHKLSKSTSLFAELSSGDVAANETNVGIHVNF